MSSDKEAGCSLSKTERTQRRTLAAHIRHGSDNAKQQKGNKIRRHTAVNRYKIAVVVGSRVV